MTKRKRRTFEEWKERFEAEEAEARANAFECAICERTVVPEYRHLRGQLAGRDGSIKPICKSCENGAHGSNSYGHRFKGVPRLYHGAFMDRRIAIQIGALAQEIEGEAHRKEWSAHYAKRSSGAA